jgi:DNA transposition AAA+ family ATPase
MKQTEWQKKINQVKELTGLNDTKIGKKVGLSQSGISKIRNGLCIPHPKNQRKIDRLLAKLEEEK